MQATMQNNNQEFGARELWASQMAQSEEFGTIPAFSGLLFAYEAFGGTDD